MYRCIPLLLLFLSVDLSAQASLRVAAFTGPAWVVDDRDNDGSGWSQGLGLTFGYKVGGRWGTLLLSVSRESFSGFDVVHDFSQRVRQLAPSQERTAVSIAMHQRGFGGYRIMVGGETSFPRRPQSRLRWGSKLGVLITAGRGQIDYEVIEQDLQGNYLPPSGEYDFLIDGGSIQRVPRADLASRYTSPLKRVNVSLQTSAVYQLTDDVQLSLSWDCAFSPLGKKYGDGQNMLGELNYLQLGLVGKVFSW